MAFWARLSAEPSPRDVLGVGPHATADEIRLAYKRRALETHPDKGGDAEDFLRVRNAYQALKTADVASVKSPLFTKPPRKAPAEYRTPYPPTPPPPAPATARGAPAPGESRLDVPAVPKRRRKTIEEEIDSAFSSIPTLRKRPKKAVAMPKAPAPVTAPPPQTGAVGDAIQRVRAMPVPTLWESLTRMEVLERERAINSLPVDVRAKLRDFLKVKKQNREGANATSAKGTQGAQIRNSMEGHNAPVMGEESSSSSTSSSSTSSSSSSSSTSSEEEGDTSTPVIRAKAAAASGSLAKAITRGDAAKPVILAPTTAAPGSLAEAMIRGGLRSPMAFNKPLARPVAAEDIAPRKKVKLKVV